MRKNKEIADKIDSLASILEFKDDNPFKINAYRRAAAILRDLTHDVQDLVDYGTLKDIPGIGEGIYKKIVEYLHTGKIEDYEKEKENIPPSLIDLLHVPNLGPKSLSKLHKLLNVIDTDSLKEAITSGKAENLPGFGKKKVQNILHGFNIYTQSKKRVPLGIALPLAKEILEEIQRIPNVSMAKPAGSLRRKKGTIGDIDILVTGENGEKIINTFTKIPRAVEVLAAGKTKGSIITEEGIQVDLRVISDESFGAALQYFTGSKEHNIALRGIAREKGYKINEYGLFRAEEILASKTEKEIYNVLGMSFIPPELREDRGEIALAISGNLPHLLEVEDIKGDLHIHSHWSDGKSSMEEIALAAKKRGYTFIALTDHSYNLKIARGLSVSDLKKKMHEIKKLNKRFDDFCILTSTEVDILSDGSIDYPDEILKELDIVVAAIHSGFKQEPEKLEQRIISAMKNPFIHIIAHPTGKLYGERDPFPIDMEKILTTAKETHTAMELNANYLRLDLDDVALKRAKELGVKIALSTDAHTEDQLWMMDLGVATARRGWLAKEDVLNTMELPEILRFCMEKERSLSKQIDYKKDKR